MDLISSVLLKKNIKISIDIKWLKEEILFWYILNIRWSKTFQ